MDVWRIIFYFLAKNRPHDHSVWDICTLRATCRLIYKASLRPLSGTVWKFYKNSEKTSRVRPEIKLPPIRYAHIPRTKTLYQVPRGTPVFKKKISQKQPLLEVSWCEPNERNHQKHKRSHHQKKKREKGDWRRSGAGEYLYEECTGYARTFCSVEEVLQERPWVESRLIVRDVLSNYGAVVAREVVAREWYDPKTGVIHYTQKYPKPKPAHEWGYWW